MHPLIAILSAYEMKEVHEHAWTPPCWIQCFLDRTVHCPWWNALTKWRHIFERRRESSCTKPSTLSIVPGTSLSAKEYACDELSTRCAVRFYLRRPTTLNLINSVAQICSASSLQLFGHSGTQRMASDCRLVDSWESCRKWPLVFKAEQMMIHLNFLLDKKARATNGPNTRWAMTQST